MQVNAGDLVYFPVQAIIGVVRGPRWEASQRGAGGDLWSSLKGCSNQVLSEAHRAREEGAAGTEQEREPNRSAVAKSNRRAKGRKKKR